MSHSQVTPGFWCQLPSGLALAYAKVHTAKLAMEMVSDARPVLADGSSPEFRYCSASPSSGNSGNGSGSGSGSNNSGSNSSGSDGSGDVTWPVIWLPRPNGGAGLSGGWAGFAKDQWLFPSDTVVFEMETATRIRTHVFRGADHETDATRGAASAAAVLSLRGIPQSPALKALLGGGDVGGAAPTVTPPATPAPGHSSPAPAPARPAAPAASNAAAAAAAAAAGVIGVMELSDYDVSDDDDSDDDGGAFEDAQEGDVEGAMAGEQQPEEEDQQQHDATGSDAGGLTREGSCDDAAPRAQQRDQTSGKRGRESGGDGADAAADAAAIGGVSQGELDAALAKRRKLTARGAATVAAKAASPDKKKKKHKDQQKDQQRRGAGSSSGSKGGKAKRKGRFSPEQQAAADAAWAAGAEHCAPLPDPLPARTPAEEAADCSGQCYWVDRIVGFRGAGARREYRIRWRGFSAAWDTWEPRAHLDAHPARYKWGLAMPRGVRRLK